MTVSVRPAGASDSEAIAAMLARLADDVRPGFVPAVTADVVARHGPAGAGLFEALLAGEPPVGLCLYGFVFSGWRGAPGLFVHDLWVAPQWRGAGLGRALLAAAVRRERHRGIAYAVLDVAPGSPAAHFYARLGFTRREEGDVFVLEADGLAALAGPPGAPLSEP